MCTMRSDPARHGHRVRFTTAPALGERLPKSFALRFREDQSALEPHGRSYGPLRSSTLRVVPPLERSCSKNQ
jgi:hypothetical protein